jgi:hypothetical protein
MKYKAASQEEKSKLKNNKIKVTEDDEIVEISDEENVVSEAGN